MSQISKHLENHPELTNDPDAATFFEQIGRIMEQTCSNGHKLEVIKNKISTVERKCDSCQGFIEPLETFMRCDSTYCKTTYCTDCVGCPDGHLVYECQLKKPLSWP